MKNEKYRELYTDPQTWKIVILLDFQSFTFFWGPKPFHDVPGPSAIDFGLIDAQNGGTASIFDPFSFF